MLQGAVSGLAAGGLYAVLALCLTLMARLVRVVNFSQAATGMFGSYVAVWLVSKHGWSIGTGAVVGVLLGGVLSAIIGLIIATWLAEADTSSRSAVTVGPLLMLVSLSFIFFGNKPQPFRPVISGPAFSGAGVVVSKVTLFTVGLAVLAAIGCRLLLTRTMFGTRLRALSERPTTAELLGIPAKTLSVAVWAVTGLVSALVILIIAPSQSNDATSLAMLVVPAAAAALLGAFRSLDLAVVGGVLLGLLQGAAAQIGSVSLVRYFIPFLFIVGFLLWMQRKEVWDAAR